jgi:hypothetical protein
MEVRHRRSSVWDFSADSPERRQARREQITAEPFSALSSRETQSHLTWKRKYMFSLLESRVS